MFFKSIYKYSQLHFVFSLTVAFFTAKAQNNFIPLDDHNIRYESRIAMQKDAAELSCSGSFVTIYFTGTNMSAVLKDADTANYYNIIIDEKDISKVHTDTIKKNYLLASGLKSTKHKIQLFKRTEWFMGKTSFYGFETLPTTAVLKALPQPKRKIEFYGNSITCGYAIDDSSNDSWHGYFENNYLTYGAITARQFKAQYHCIARSGIGIILSWQPLIMPEMYDRLDPTDSSSKWDFKKYS